jgi:hypothetical protein
LGSEIGLVSLLVARPVSWLGNQLRITRRKGGAALREQYTTTSWLPTEHACNRAVLQPGHSMRSEL